MTDRIFTILSLRATSTFPSRPLGSLSRDARERVDAARGVPRDHPRGERGRGQALCLSRVQVYARESVR